MNTKTFVKRTNLDELHALFNVWTLDIETRKRLDKHFILYWTPSYLVQQLALDSTHIMRDGIRYEVRMKDSLADIEQAKQVRLSFRKSDKLDIAVVLVNFKY
jgi:hypothetical protein